MDYAEQIKSWRLKLQEVLKQQAEIMDAANSDGDGRTLTEDEQNQYDALTKETQTIKGHIGRIEHLQSQEAEKAEPPASELPKGEPQQGQSRGAPSVITRHPEDKFEGQSFTRLVIAKAVGFLEGAPAAEIAQRRWGKSHPLLVEWIKASVTGAGSETGDWGAELVQADAQFTGDFIEFLYKKTVFDQLPLRDIPAYVTVKGRDGEGVGYWVGEGAAIPATDFDFNDVTLTPKKVAALTSVSNEWLRDSTPSGEVLVRDGLVKASAQRTDATFISADAETTSAAPGIFNGLSALGSAGSDADAVREDIGELVSGFLGALNPASDLWWIMNPATGLRLQLLRNSFGQKEFPDVNANGGILEGYPVVTGDNVDNGTVALVKPSDLYRIGDTGIRIEVSKDATIEMDDSPTGNLKTPTAASANLQNMFQQDSTAIKVVRSINFARRRDSSVQFMVDAFWGQSGTSTT